MKYGITGASGRMGKVLLEVFGPDDCVATVSIEEKVVLERPEVMVDFSRPDALVKTVDICGEYGAALVLGTTALKEKHFEMIRGLSKTVPVVQGYNFSMGIGLLKMMLRDYSSALKDWDVEICETHHIHKIDAPSGTAFLLRDAVGRECSIHSMRLGGVPGDHIVSFANEGEVLSFEHRAISRRVFAMGAFKAAEFAVESAPGLYDFEEVVKCALKR